MTLYKRIGIALLILFAVLIVTQTFIHVDIKQRIIVLGVVMDYNDNMFEIACEVVVPSASSSDSGGGGARKILCGKGKTVSIAFQSLNQYNGYLFSLGQCNLIALCKNLITSRNVSDVLAYFAFSDAFKDGVTVAACEPSPKDFFDASLPLESYVSFAVHNAILGNGKRINVPSMSILDFVKAQSTITAGSFLPYITFETEKQPDKTQPTEQANQKHIKIDSIALFDKGEFKGFLSKNHLKYFNVLNDEENYHVFSVNDTIPNETLPRSIAVGSINKSVETSYIIKDNKPTLIVNLEMEIKRLRTDTDGAPLPFQPLGEREITSEISRQVQNECMKGIEEIYTALQHYNCDILQIYSGFFKNLGKDWIAYTTYNQDWFSKFTVSVKCKVI